MYVSRPSTNREMANPGCFKSQQIHDRKKGHNHGNLKAVAAVTIVGRCILVSGCLYMEVEGSVITASVAFR